jgi:hypothetical protein
MPCRNGALVLAAASIAFARDLRKVPAQPGIRGVALEPAPNQPVAGAEISFCFPGEEQPSIRVGLGPLTPARRAGMERFP